MYELTDNFLNFGVINREKLEIYRTYKFIGQEVCLYMKSIYRTRYIRNVFILYCSCTIRQYVDF